VVVNVVLDLVERADQAAAELLRKACGDICLMHGELKRIPVGVAALVRFASRGNKPCALAIEIYGAARLQAAPDRLGFVRRLAVDLSVLIHKSHQLDDGPEGRAGTEANGGHASTLVRQQQIVKELKGQRLGRSGGAAGSVRQAERWY
jgi:hypothetical protein